MAFELNINWDIYHHLNVSAKFAKTENKKILAWHLREYLITFPIPIAISTNHLNIWIVDLVTRLVGKAHFEREREKKNTPISQNWWCPNFCHHFLLLLVFLYFWSNAQIFVYVYSIFLGCFFSLLSFSFRVKALLCCVVAH